jgi:hypothetical protein
MEQGASKTVTARKLFEIRRVVTKIMIRRLVVRKLMGMERDLRCKKRWGSEGRGGFIDSNTEKMGMKRRAYGMVKMKLIKAPGVGVDVLRQW